MPPAELSAAAIDGRLRRIFKPRKDGSYLLDESWVAQYRDKDTRDKLLSMFEKVGYNVDRVGERMGFQLKFLNM